MTNCILF